MTLILNGTDNSATTPAVTGTDTDTGIYYPAANQVAIATNGTQAMLVDTSQNVTFAGYANLPNTFGFKNRIINGAMVIDQRNAGASITTASGNNYDPDRWLVYDAVGSKMSVQQVTDAPAGFVKSQKITSLAATTPSSTDYYFNCQRIEGFNIADFGWGTASAATVTLSFWVKSSLTGSFSGAFGNASFSRSYPFSYTISAANTWEQKTVTVAGDTTGTWATDNSTGIQVVFDLGSGSSRAGTANVWSANDYRKVTGSVNLIGTNGATFYVTGVQLEKGSTATSFDYRPYGTEFQLCQRYCQVNGGVVSNQLLSISWAYSTTAAIVACLLPVPMRATPSLSYSAVGDWAVFNGGAGGPYTCTSIALNRASPTSLALEFVASTLTAGQAGAVLANNTTNAKLILSAEL
jgi:hypothetical protein